MISAATMQTEAAPIVACTVSRDVQNFALLIDDMERELGETWGDLTFDEAAVFIEQPDGNALEFIAVAVDGRDEINLDSIGALVRKARAKGIGVLIVAHDLSPIALHKLLRTGANDFVPYPLPDGALREAIARLREPPPPPLTMPLPGTNPGDVGPGFKPRGDRDGILLAVHGMAGGVGATTFATNLAWELATVTKTDPPRVCLLDLDLQFGAISTALDLPRRDAVFEILSDMSGIDSEAFLRGMITFRDRLHVFTAPPDLLPLDLLTPEDIGRLLDMALSNFDFVIVDMPHTIITWTETVLNRAHVYFALIELELRSAQNVLRLLRAMKAEDLPFEKLRYVLNRAPKFTDFSAKGRVKRMAESLDIAIEVQLPDGGAQVTQANDHGHPLAEGAAKNPLRREIQKLAKSLYDLNRSVETARS